jgi:hypothetical protein
MTAMLRIASLLLVAFFAVVSTVGHAAPPPPVAISSHHQGHQPTPTSHNNHKAPCCEMQACIGCAVVPPAIAIVDAAVAPTATSLAAAPAKAFAGRLSLPDVPPPRLLS